MKRNAKTKAELMNKVNSLDQQIARLEARRQQLEDELKELQPRYRSFIEQTTDAVFCYEYDPPIPTDIPLDEQVPRFYQGVLVECNDVAARFYGHERAEEELRKYREHLEELVDARTAELQQANQQLEQEIVERKRAEDRLKQTLAELERSNADLERFNRLAVGREVRMIELKRQINDLPQELDREPLSDLSLLEE